MDFLQPLTNNLKKLVSSLKNKKFRDEEGLFVAEGFKLCSELSESDYKTQLVIVRSGFKEETGALTKKFHALQVPVYIARKQQFDGLCDTVTPQEIIAVAEMDNSKGQSDNPCILLDNINDPGNVGTIIRTADWFGYGNIVLGGSSADKFNPKVIRSTMGSIFRMNIITAESLEDYIKRSLQGFEIYAASLQSKTPIEKINPSSKYAILLGSEAHGISGNLTKLITHDFIIRGKGGAESLNVAVSAGIAMNYFSFFEKYM